MALEMISGQDTKLAVTRIGTGTPQAVVAPCDGDTTAVANLGIPYANIDLRGQGQSQIDPSTISTMSLDSYMADLEATTAHLKTSGVPFIAYSQTGFFITHYAATHPEAVSKLVLIEPALFTERNELLKRAELAEKGDADASVAAMLRYVQPTVGLSASAAAPVRKAIVATAQSPEFIAASFRIRADNPVTERHLRALKMPVLLIGGTDSHVKDMVTRAASMIPNSSVWWIPKAQHLDILDPQFAPQLSRVLGAFLG